MIVWDEKQLHWHLNTRRFGRQARYFDVLDSSNRWLLEHIGEFTLSGGAVIAGHQTAGRGRHSRNWSDLPGSSLLCSVLLKVPGKHLAKGFLAMLPAIALCRAIRRHDASAEVRLKWPNDVLLNHKKTAGILAESAGLDFVIVGIGVNITAVPDGDFIYPATSLSESSRWRPTREVLLAELLNEWEPLFDLFLEEQFSDLRAAWEEFGPAAGTKLRRTESGEEITGEFVGIGTQGQLQLKLSTGEIRELFSGDITDA